MPFVTKEKDPDYIPTNRKTNWGEPKGRVRHIDIRGNHALYVIEEEPAKVPVKMVGRNRVMWSHEVWLPWRYYVIKVHSNCRVFGKEAGFMFFAMRRVESLGETGVLKKAMFPNIFKGSGICLGFTGHIWDKTPLKAAWAAVRMIYSKPGNQWMAMDESNAPTILSAKFVDQEDHSDHRLVSYGPDFSCRWAQLSREESLAIGWPYPAYQSLEQVLKHGEWNYNSTRTFSEEEVEGLMRAQERTNRLLGGSIW